MEKHIKSWTDLIRSLVDDNKRKHNDEENEKRRKKARTYAVPQNYLHSSKRHEVSKICDGYDTSAATEQ